MRNIISWRYQIYSIEVFMLIYFAMLNCWTWLEFFLWSEQSVSDANSNKSAQPLDLLLPSKRIKFLDGKQYGRLIDSWNSWNNRSRQQIALMSGIMLNLYYRTCRPLSSCLIPLLAAKNIKKQPNGMCDSRIKLGENPTGRTNGLHENYQHWGNPQDYCLRFS